MLSLGFTRELWEDPAQAGDDSLARLSAYSEYLDVLPRDRPLAARARAREPAPDHADAVGPRHRRPRRLHSWTRMVALGRRLARAHGFDLVQSRTRCSRAPRASGRLRAGAACPTTCASTARARSIRSGRASRPGRGRPRRSAGASFVPPTACRWTAHARGVRSAPPGWPADALALKPMVPHDLDRVLRRGARSLAARRAFRRRAVRSPGALRRVGWRRRRTSGACSRPRRGSFAPGRASVLVLVGEGPERARLEADAARRGLAERVLWLGARPHVEVARVMAACDVLLPAVPLRRLRARPDGSGRGGAPDREHGRQRLGRRGRPRRDRAASCPSATRPRSAPRSASLLREPSGRATWAAADSR